MPTYDYSTYMITLLKYPLANTASYSSLHISQLQIPHLIQREVRKANTCYGKALLTWYLTVFDVIQVDIHRHGYYGKVQAHESMVAAIVYRF